MPKFLIVLSLHDSSPRRLQETIPALNATWPREEEVKMGAWSRRTNFGRGTGSWPSAKIKQTV